MNIQRFLAPTAREALAKARAAFGDDTLILSNRQLPDGVEVMAATEAALALIDSQTPAPKTPNRPTQPFIRQPIVRILPSERGRPGHASTPEKMQAPAARGKHRTRRLSPALRCRRKSGGENRDAGG